MEILSLCIGIVLGAVVGVVICSLRQDAEPEEVIKRVDDLPRFTVETFKTADIICETSIPREKLDWADSESSSEMVANDLKKLLGNEVWKYALVQKVDSEWSRREFYQTYRAHLIVVDRGTVNFLHESWR